MIILMLNNIKLASGFAAETCRRRGRRFCPCCHNSGTADRFSVTMKLSYNMLLLLLLSLALLATLAFQKVGSGMLFRCPLPRICRHVCNCALSLRCTHPAALAPPPAPPLSSSQPVQGFKPPNELIPRLRTPSVILLFSNFACFASRMPSTIHLCTDGIYVLPNVDSSLQLQSSPIVAQVCLIASAANSISSHPAYYSLQHHSMQRNRILYRQ
jgi:hypothetical protein